MKYWVSRCISSKKLIVYLIYVIYICQCIFMYNIYIYTYMCVRLRILFATPSLAILSQSAWKPWLKECRLKYLYSLNSKIFLITTIFCDNIPTIGFSVSFYKGNLNAKCLKDGVKMYQNNLKSLRISLYMVLAISLLWY